MLFTRAGEAADAVRALAAEAPRVGVVLGSGLGELADRVAGAVAIPYARIPHFPEATVAGHAGNLVVGRLAGVPAVVLQGRFHYYEGHDLAVVTFPIRVLQRLGATALVLTAATGGVRDDLGPGDLVALADHLNLIGGNPLRGENDPRLGERFPDLTAAYSPRLRNLAAIEADRLGIELKQGVYACVSGPCYETPAEVRMLRALGADVVGMSTVPEAIVARHAGIEVLGLALVSNRAAGLSGRPLSHDEVLAAGRASAGRMADLIEAVVGRIGSEGIPG